MTASTLSGEEYRLEWASWLTEVFGNAVTQNPGSGTFLQTLTFAPREWERDSIGSLGPTRSRVMRAGRRYERVLMSSLARPSYFGVRELGGWNGRAHLHFLISCAERAVISEATLRHSLSEGFVKGIPCTMSPTEYVSKYVSKSDGDWWVAGGPAFHGGGGRSAGPSVGGRANRPELF